MKEIVACSDLQIGMFVTDLDRPWIESPFMIQGFLVEDEETLGQIRELCRFVTIDRARSVGEAHAGRAQEDVSSKVGQSLKGRPREETQAESARHDGAELPGFMEILHLIRSGKLDELPKVEPGVAGRVAEPRAAYGGASRSRGSPAEAVNFDEADSSRKPLFGSLRNLFARRSKADKTGPDPSLRSMLDADQEEQAGQDDDFVPLEHELVYVAPVFVETIVALDKVLADVSSNIAPDLGKLGEGVEDMVRSVARNPDALLWLTRLKATDEYSYQHALDTSVHMMIFARTLGMGEESTRLLGMAGMLHDVGKVRMPPRLLQKNARLTPLEYEILKTHVDYSLKILQESPEATQALVDIVARHHERIDGSGYPAGLANDEIGLNAEIAGLVDSYTAMTGKREYGVVYSTHRALEDLIRLRGTKYRETLVDQFVQCMGIYPVGSLVELNSGEIAVVISQNRVRRLKPRVMVLLAPDKSPNTYPPMLDLLYEPTTPTGETYSIVRAVAPDAYGIDPQEFYLS